MAEKVILAEQDLAFGASGVGGLYLWQAVPSVIFLTEGEDYVVVWDGEEFPCKATAMSLGDVNGLGLGNPAFAGLGENTGEPFLLGVAIDGSFSACYTTDNDETNRVAVYQVTTEVGIVQYDRSGNRLEFFGKKVIRVPTTDGGTKDFVGATLTEKTVELDFSDGDMTIEPEAEEFYTKVNVPAPVTLIPANIAEGVNIAGIVGTLATVSGANVKFASGTFTGVAGHFDVEHNLGVVPDILYLYTKYKPKSGNLIGIQSAFGMSKAFIEKCSPTIGQFFTTLRYYSSNYHYVSVSEANNLNSIDMPNGTGVAVLYGATGTTFGVGISLNINQWECFPDQTYYWLAIGGLT